MVEARFGFGETAHLVRTVRHRALAGRQITQHGKGGVCAAKFLVLAAAMYFEAQVDMAVFTHVAPDIGRVGDDFDAEGLQQCGRANAGKLKQLGRLDRAGRQDDFSTGVHETLPLCAAKQDGGCPLSCKFDAKHVRQRHEVEVGALEGRAQECTRRAEAPSLVARIGLVAEAAVPDGSKIIHIAPARHAHLLARGYDRIEQRVALGMGGDALRASGTAPLGGAQIVILQFDELGADIGPSPTGTAHRGPAIVVERCAAHVDHAVGRTGTSQCAAAEPTLIGLSGAGVDIVLPDVLAAGIVDHAEAARHVDQQALVGRTAFDQQHRETGISR